MHWMAILPMLVLAATATFLIVLREWEPWEAYSLVAGGALLATILLIGLLLALTPPGARAQLWAEVRTTIANDLRGLWNAIRWRK